MKGLRVLLAAVVVSVGVALTYHFFELAVRESTIYLWDTLLNTDSKRLLVIPVCLVLSVVYFAAQHIFDRRAETHESHGLGDTPTPTVVNFIKVVAIGFLSLLAGASLGPEAILVPACTILGAYVGKKLFRRDAVAPKLLSMVGFVALFAAFFGSFVAGMLGLLLVLKQTGAKMTTNLAVLAAVASATTVGALKLLESGEYMPIPAHTSISSWQTAAILVVLAAAGMMVPFIIKYTHTVFEAIKKAVAQRHWLLHAFLAALGLSLLYVLGGPLVQFTGNQSVAPMFEQASSLGLAGLLGIVVVKLLAISWSKTMGYRGGLIFPTIFVASVFVAISQIVVPEVSITWGIVAVMVGVIAADSKTKILF